MNNEQPHQPSSLPTPSPLSMERREKLKIYAMTAVHKDFKPEDLKDKMALSLLAAYTNAEAIIGAVASLKATVGLDPNDFKIPFHMVEAPIEQFVQTGLTAVELMPYELKKILDVGEFKPMPLPPDVYKDSPQISPMDMTKEKKLEEFIADIRYVFDAVGTDTQKKMAETVIKKFRNHARKLTK